MKGRHSLYSFLLCSLCLLCASSLFSQVITVQNEDLEPLFGVEVYTDNLSFGKTTDIDGQLDLSDLNHQNVWLYFRYLGYKSSRLTLQQIELAGNVIIMNQSDQIIEEVIVLGRKSVSAKEIPFQIATIDQQQIIATNPQTSADALSQHGGVYVQKSQMGGGSPVIRGFEANRVLLVVDDIRMNNAIYRSGHLQNAITVDQTMLDRMEIIFGPNSLMYGSDALGGVVNFKTRQPSLSEDGEALLKHGYAARYASANQEKMLHYDLSYGREKWGSLTSITAVDYDDLRTGSQRDDRFPDFGKRLTFQSQDALGNDIAITNPDPNVQVSTGYGQLDILQKFLFTPSEHHRLSANLQISTSTDVPRYDNLSEVHDGQLRWAEWYYGPQKRVMAAVDYRYLKETKAFDQLTVIGAYQKIDEDRISRIFGQADRLEQMEDVHVWSLTADASKSIGKNETWSLQYGADLQTNDVISSATQTNSNTDAKSAALTRYANGDNQLTNIGVYLYTKGQLQEDINLSGGLRWAISKYLLRYDQNSLVTWPAQYYEGVGGDNAALTGSLGITWQVTPHWQIRSMLSTAFRSPNIDDLSKVRINGGEITFPNLDLSPEKSKNAELTLTYQHGDRLQISTTGFFTRLDDAITRKPYSLVDGSTTWRSQGETLAIVANQNVQSARIYGMSVNLSGEIANDWTYLISYNITKGEELITGEESLPFAHIPPAYGKIGLTYKRDKWTIQGVMRYNAHKPLDLYGGSADNPDLASPDGALAWSTYNLYSTYSVSDALVLTLSVENVFDKHYRPFASGVSAPGRNVILAFRGKF